MRNKHVTRFGNPSTRNGAVYVVSDQEGLFQTAVDLEYLRLYVDDIPITPLIEERVQDRVRREQLLLKSNLSSLGIPEKLKKLLEIDTKSESNKFCRKLKVDEFEFFLLIHNCNQIGFNHQSKFPEYVPEHLTVTESDRENLHLGKLKPISKKLLPLMKERRRIHVHLFEQEQKWRCFYYSYDDILTDEKSHWKFGCHLHYVSYLWPKYNKDQILELFDIRKTSISGAFHIRFSPFDYPQSQSLGVNIPFSEFGRQPTLLVINSKLPSNPNVNPVPTAQLATRGFWSGEISTGLGKIYQ